MAIDDVKELIKNAAKYLYTTKEYLTLTIQYFSNMQIIEKPEVGTMATDADFNLYYNEEFVLENKKYLPAILLHELFHHIYGSFERFDELNEKATNQVSSMDAWNIASDLAINEIINMIFPEINFLENENIVSYKTFLKILAKLELENASEIEIEKRTYELENEILKYQNSEYYYFELMKRIRQRQNNKNNSNETQIEDKNRNSHEFSKEQRKQNNQKNTQNNASKFDKHSNNTNNHNQNKKDKNKVINDMIKNSIEKYIKEEIIKRGYDPGDGALIIEKNIPATDKTTTQKILQIVKEKINLLRQRDKKKISKKYFVNKIFIKDPILINKDKKNFIINLAFCIDASGSMASEINEVFSKLENSLITIEKNSEASFKIRYIECDTDITENILFNSFKDFKNYIKDKKFVKGAGGTSIIPPLKFLLTDKDPYGNRKKSDIIIYFTDGYIDDEDTILPILRQLKKQTKDIIISLPKDSSNVILNKLKKEIIITRTN